MARRLGPSIGKPTIHRSIIALLQIAAFACLPSFADEGLDTVSLITPALSSDGDWTARPRAQRRGTIEDFDQLRLKLIDAEGETKQFGSHTVLGVSFKWATESAAAASQLVDDQEYSQAVEAIRTCYQKLPKWQQRLLLARLVRCLSAAGNDRLACVIFNNVASDSTPPPLVFADIPLCWTTKQTSTSHAAAAKQWIASDQEVPQLLGASWLLANNRAQAEQTLRKLKASKDPIIARLAVMQSWRLEPPPKSKTQITAWIAYRDKLLLPLQLGPTEFLADRLSRIGEQELALGQWSRIATLFPHRHFRAKRALTAAAAQLVQMQRDEEAEKINVWKRSLN